MQGLWDICGTPINLFLKIIECCLDLSRAFIDENMLTMEMTRSKLLHIKKREINKNSTGTQRIETMNIPENPSLTFINIKTANTISKNETTIKQIPKIIVIPFEFSTINLIK